MRRDIWIFLFALGLVLFGWPFLSIFGMSTAFYLFVAWTAYVLLIFIFSHITGKDGGEG